MYVVIQAFRQLLQQLLHQRRHHSRLATRYVEAVDDDAVALQLINHAEELRRVKRPRGVRSASVGAEQATGVATIGDLDKEVYGGRHP